MEKERERERDEAKERERERKKRGRQKPQKPAKQQWQRSHVSEIGSEVKSDQCAGRF